VLGGVQNVLKVMDQGPDQERRQWAGKRRNGYKTTKRKA